MRLIRYTPYAVRGEPWLSGLHDFCEFIPNVKELILVEIGSHIGEAAEIFCQHFRHVCCIEPFIAVETLGDIHLRKCMFLARMMGYKNWSLIEAFSPRIACLFEDNSIDVVYVDGNHEYSAVKADIEAFLPKVKRAGYMAGHDYNNHQEPGVKQAVDEIFGAANVIVFQDTSWLVKMESYNGKH